MAFLPLVVERRRPINARVWKVGSCDYAHYGDFRRKPMRTKMTRTQCLKTDMKKMGVRNRGVHERVSCFSGNV